MKNAEDVPFRKQVITPTKPGEHKLGTKSSLASQTSEYVSLCCVLTGISGDFLRNKKISLTSSFTFLNQLLPKKDVET